MADLTESDSDFEKKDHIYENKTYIKKNAQKGVGTARLKKQYKLRQSGLLFPDKMFNSHNISDFDTYEKKQNRYLNQTYLISNLDMSSTQLNQKNLLGLKKRRALSYQRVRTALPNRVNNMKPPG